MREDIYETLYVNYKFLKPFRFVSFSLLHTHYLYPPLEYSSFYLYKRRINTYGGVLDTQILLCRLVIKNLLVLTVRIKEVLLGH